MTTPIKERLSAQEYSKLPETTQPTELIDGEIITMPTPFIIHQRLVLFLVNILQKMSLEGSIWIAPLDVHLDAYNVVQPDVFWIAKDSICVSPDGKYWHGAPDLVIEVLSESTAKHDKTTKFKLYETHGSHEYWMVDPNYQLIEVWYRVDERFVQLGVFLEGDTFASPTLKQPVLIQTMFESKTT
jgi:Uma2 family endonuclease